MTQSIFASLLHAEAPAPDLKDKLDLYGRFVGDWDSEVTAYAPGGATFAETGEIHFGWILEGRAIQDIWMIPRRDARASGMTPFPVAGNWYGTTLRIYDSTIDAWRIFWIDPGRHTFRQQIGRREGADIVQEGRTESGSLSRWRFTEISPNSFRWLGEASNDDGKTWRLIVEVRAKRRVAEAEAANESVFERSGHRFA